MIGAALLALCAALPAGDRGRDDPRPNDPAQCPWCGGEPARMAAAGVLSHGGFGFGRTDTAEVDAWLATDDIKWVETAHFEIGFALGPYRVRQEEKNKVRAELERLQAALPGVKVKSNPLDPWLRAHLYAQRAEDLWTRFLELTGVEASAFPDGTKPWDMTGKYMGEGPYLGMKQKYEVLILPSEATSVAYLDHQFGLRHVTTQRWHLPEEGTISVTIHTDQAQLRMDAALHNHLAFNLAHNFLDGYKHYSYETPVWLHTGLAHFMEREIDPRYNTFDTSEGAVEARTSKSRWDSQVLGLIAAGKAPRFAQLVALKTYAELDLDDNFATWSMVDFLVRARPDDFAALVDGLKGLTRADGLPDGGRVQDRQRELFKELFGWSYGEFDQAWRDWAQTDYR